MQTDLFRRFVDLLADSLDDVPTAADLADRLHMSRVHVDRLVLAAAGETPAALRRRVLLERAAHRLLTTDDEVLAVALDAGFDSHEGFTRAFGRAYGAPPSRWRADASTYRLPPTRSVHFRPPGGLDLPPSSEAISMSLARNMIEHHVWLVGEMLDRARSLDDDVLDRPIEISVEGVDDDPTLRSLLARLVGQMSMWELAEQGAADYDLASERNLSLAQIRTWLDDVGPRFLDLARRIDEEDLTQVTFVNAMCEPPELFSYGGLIAHVLTFAAFRRTLVCGALWSAGITDLGAGDPREWVSRPV
ncbi:MAG TPA: AraC family transcriptional regulator [Candidatus Nanopelagicales bacterium]|nr:AraC family transcriptional regulator [Candidatus Nanopelagicales bacterium]